jgi:hypothetical protein
MTSQVIFTVDKALKDRAMKKAKAEGIPFAAVLKLATKSYVEGSLSVRLFEEDPPLHPAAAKRLGKAVKDARAGKNLSPSFSNAKDAIRFLKS